jgi:outer membrane protein TolC
VKEAPNPAVVPPLEDAVAAKTRVRDEAQQRFDAGRINKNDLLVAEVDLSEARLKLAEEERKPAEVVAHLEALVKQRQEERDLIAVRVEVGGERGAVLVAADARLADAKARLAKVKPEEVKKWRAQWAKYPPREEK